MATTYRIYRLLSFTCTGSFCLFLFYLLVELSVSLSEQRSWAPLKRFGVRSRAGAVWLTHIQADRPAPGVGGEGWNGSRTLDTTGTAPLQMGTQVGTGEGDAGCARFLFSAALCSGSSHCWPHLHHSLFRLERWHEPSADGSVNTHCPPVELRGTATACSALIKQRFEPILNHLSVRS